MTAVLGLSASHVVYAAEVPVVPKQSLVPLRYLSVPLVSVASAVLVLVVPEQSLSSSGVGAHCAALVS